MALPMLIIMAALLLWTLIPEPDQDGDPGERPASKRGGSPCEYYPEHGDSLRQEPRTSPGSSYDACPHRTGVLIAL